MKLRRTRSLARLIVRNYRGIQFLDTAKIFPDGIPPEGMLIKGSNGEGKTSVLNAVLAALAGNDIGPDAIHTDADRSEILVDLGDISVERSITASGSRLVVKDENDKAIPSPSKWLASVLGTTLDPLAFASEKPKDRKRYILSAMPVTVDRAQIDAWIGDGPKTSEDLTLDLDLHGLEVVDQVRKDYEAQRKIRNAELKTLEKDEHALIQGAPPAVPDAPAIEEADRIAAAKSAELAELKSRVARVHAQGEKTRATRERATSIVQEADALAAIPNVHAADITAAAASFGVARDEALARNEIVESIGRQIVELQKRQAEAVDEAHAAARKAAEAEAACDALRSRQAEIDREHARAEELRKQAAELEAAVVATSEVAPTAEEIATAEAALDSAQKDQTNARAAQHRREHEAKIAAIAEKRAAVGVVASQLDAMVQKFAREVPDELITKANGIEGLTVDGDEVFLEGVRFSKLSGREQILFGVRLAKRLNGPRARILVTDGLEKVDDDMLPDFLAEATSDGFQLIATRVCRGGIEFEAIGAAEEGEDHG